MPVAQLKAAAIPSKAGLAAGIASRSNSIINRNLESPCAKVGFETLIMLQKLSKNIPRQKHFSEGRHSMGMSTLGIPNSKEYYGLTKIEEVKALHKKLTEEKKEKLTWNRDEDEEFEDSEGNVLSRETYENLKRNGLL